MYSSIISIKQRGQLSGWCVPSLNSELYFQFHSNVDPNLRFSPFYPHEIYRGRPLTPKDELMWLTMQTNVSQMKNRTVSSSRHPNLSLFPSSCIVFLVVRQFIVVVFFVSMLRCNASMQATFLHASDVFNWSLLEFRFSARARVRVGSISPSTIPGSGPWSSICVLYFLITQINDCISSYKMRISLLPSCFWVAAWSNTWVSCPQAENVTSLPATREESKNIYFY